MIVTTRKMLSEILYFYRHDKLSDRKYYAHANVSRDCCFLKSISVFVMPTAHEPLSYRLGVRSDAL